MMLSNLLLRFSFSKTEQCTVKHGYGEFKYHGRAI